MQSTAANPIPELPRYLRGPWKKGQNFVKLFRVYESAKLCPALAMALLIHRFKDKEAKHIANEIPGLKSNARRAIQERRAKP